VVIWDFHPDSKTAVVLSQQPTLIPDVPIRPSFIKHKRFRDPEWEARMLSRYLYDKAEAGTTRHKDEKGILV
jgi:hypothetical protein